MTTGGIKQPIYLTVSFQKLKNNCHISLWVTCVHREAIASCLTVYSATAQLIGPDCDCCVGGEGAPGFGTRCESILRQNEKYKDITTGFLEFRRLNDPVTH